MPPVKKFATVDEYISHQEPHAQQQLEAVRRTVLKAAPGAIEKISYSMPAIYLQGIVVWYAAFKNHIGLYPKAAAIETFRDRLTAYKCAKGSIQLPIDQPMPLKLIADIVYHRAKENALAAAGKK